MNNNNNSINAGCRAYLVNEQFSIFCNSQLSEGNPSELRNISIVGQNGPEICYDIMNDDMLDRFMHFIYSQKSVNAYISSNEYNIHKNRIKGDIFEDYCLNLLSKSDFIIKGFTQRRGVYIDEDMKRDAKIQHVSNGTILNIDFKFRSGETSFSTHEQLMKYVNYDKPSEFFHIIGGKGGKPYNPDVLYIIPVFIYKNEINQGRIVPTLFSTYEIFRRPVANADIFYNEISLQWQKLTSN